MDRWPLTSAVARPDVGESAASSRSRDPVVREEGGTVLHVVGRVTESVQSFLAPMTRALLDASSPQVVVMLDAPELQSQLMRFDPRVEILAVPTQTPGWRHWIALFNAVHAQLRTRPISAVHFHGLRPWAIGLGLSRRRVGNAAIYLSPHGSRLMWLLRLVAPIASVAMRNTRSQPAYIASSFPDAAMMSHSGVEPLVVEGAVGDVYFNVRRHETSTPLVVAGNHRDARGDVELASRLAVIFGSAELGLAFSWFGPIGEESLARLVAAKVGVFSDLEDGELASRMSSGWVFLAPGADTHFPVRLAQAMAAGLPCLVADTAMHRTMIEHGVTGLIYDSEASAQSHLTQLVDSPALRQKLGIAARETASQRFSAGRIRDQLSSIYGTVHLPE